MPFAAMGIFLILSRTKMHIATSRVADRNSESTNSRHFHRNIKSGKDGLVTKSPALLLTTASKVQTFSSGKDGQVTYFQELNLLPCC